MNEHSASTNLNMLDSGVHLGNNEQNKDINEQNKDIVMNVTYEDIKNQYGKVGGDLNSISSMATHPNRAQEEKINASRINLQSNMMGVQKKGESQ